MLKTEERQQLNVMWDLRMDFGTEKGYGKMENFSINGKTGVIHARSVVYSTAPMVIF